METHKLLPESAYNTNTLKLELDSCIDEYCINELGWKRVYQYHDFSAILAIVAAAICVVNHFFDFLFGGHFHDNYNYHMILFIIAGGFLLFEEYISRFKTSRCAAIWKVGPASLIGFKSRLADDFSPNYTLSVIDIDTGKEVASFTHDASKSVDALGILYVRELQKLAAPFLLQVEKAIYSKKKSE